MTRCEESIFYTKNKAKDYRHKKLYYYLRQKIYEIEDGGIFRNFATLFDTP